MGVVGDGRGKDLLGIFISLNLFKVKILKIFVLIFLVFFNEVEVRKVEVVKYFVFCNENRRLKLQKKTPY